MPESVGACLFIHVRVYSKGMNTSAFHGQQMQFKISTRSYR